MRCIRKIQEDLYWVGAEDRKARLFENIFPIPRGMAYNSYLLIDEKIVLLDTVDQTVSKQFLENIEYMLKNKTIDYLIINHMEPDHAAVIQELSAKYPNMKIIGNIQIQKLLKQFFTFDVESKMQIVKENEILNTGKHQLKFIFAPMVHWPEVMVTYDEYSKTLFSADAFGSFGTLNGNLFNTDINIEKEFINEARRYYANIVGKYGMQVQSLLRKLNGTEIQTLCPLHGQVWKENINYIINKYDKWSKYEPEEKSVIIVYSTIYGHTENAVNILANYLGENGIKNIKVYDVSQIDVSYLVAESFRSSHIVIATAMYNMSVFPKMQEYIEEISRLNLKNRTVSLIVNSSWGPEHSNKIKEKLEKMTVLEEKLIIKSAIKEENMEQIKKVGDSIIKQIMV